MFRKIVELLVWTALPGMLLAFVAAGEWWSDPQVACLGEECGLTVDFGSSGLSLLQSRAMKHVHAAASFNLKRPGGDEGERGVRESLAKDMVESIERLEGEVAALSLLQTQSRLVHSVPTTPSRTECSAVLPLLAEKGIDDGQLEMLCQRTFPDADCAEIRDAIGARPWSMRTVQTVCEYLGTDAEWHAHVELASLLGRRSSIQLTQTGLGSAASTLQQHLDAALSRKLPAQNNVGMPPYNLSNAPPSYYCGNITNVSLDGRIVPVYGANCTTTTTTTTIGVDGPV